MKHLMTVILLFASVSVAAGALAQPANSLSTVKRVYVEKMDNNLDQYLISAISKKFHGALTVVLDKGNADAILRTSENNNQGTTKGTVELVDPTGRMILWSGTAGDRNKLIRKHEGDERIADALMDQLKKAMEGR